MPAAYPLISGVVLVAAFSLPTGQLGLNLIAVGALFAAAHGGNSVAIVKDVTHPTLSAAVTATAVRGTNLLGLAPGLHVVGLLSDMSNLKTALATAPMVSVVSALLFAGASRYYERDVAAIGKGYKR